MPDKGIFYACTNSLKNGAYSLVYAVIAAQTAVVVLSKGRYALFNFNIMTKNNESPASTINGQTETRGSYSRYSEMFTKCTISKHTANFLACIKQLYDLSDSFYEAHVETYGEVQTEEFFTERYIKKREELEEVLLLVLRQSITENIALNKVNEI